MMATLNKTWKFEEKYPKISGYTTTYNCVSGEYPFEKAIKSFSFLDEVIVVDGGSTDGTKERLQALCTEHPNVKIYDFQIDLDNPGCDGQQKALARAMCSNEFCLQFDADEINMSDPKTWNRTAKNFPSDTAILECPVIEPIGDITNVRLNETHNPMKWRLSRNLPEITHGIPDFDRLEKDGKIHAKNSDGTLYISIVDNRIIPSKFVNKNCEMLYQLRKTGEKEKYSEIILQLMKQVPCVLHQGHVNLEGKIKLYTKTWYKFWNNLYARDNSDPKNNVYFPGISYEDVTDDMIAQKAKDIMRETPSIKISSLKEYE